MAFRAILKFIKRALRLKKRHPRRKAKKPRVKRVKPRKKHLKPPKRARRKKTTKATKTAKFAKHPKPVKAEMIGVVTHYFPKVRAAVLKLKKPLSIGEPIWVKGKITDFRQTVASMQIERKPIENARVGSEVGLEVFSEVNVGDIVYRMKG